MASLRKRIDHYCKSCVYDSSAAGTWRQQVSLCAVTSCPLHDVRPKTTRTIPDSVLTYYGIESPSFERQKDDS